MMKRACVENRYRRRDDQGEKLMATAATMSSSLRCVPRRTEIIVEKLWRPSRMGMGQGEKRWPGKKNATGFDRPKGRHTRWTRVIRCVRSSTVVCRVGSCRLR